MYRTELRDNDGKEIYVTRQQLWNIYNSCRKFIHCSFEEYLKRWEEVKDDNN